MYEKGIKKKKKSEKKHKDDHNYGMAFSQEEPPNTHSLLEKESIKRLQSNMIYKIMSYIERINRE